MPEAEQYIFETDIHANINTTQAQSNLDKLRKTAEEVGDKIGAAFRNANQVMREGLDRVGDVLIDIQAPAEQLGRTMQMVASIGHQMGQQISSALERVKNDFSRLGNDIKTNWRTVPQYVFGSLKDERLLADLRRAIEKQMEAISGAVQSSQKWVRDGYRELAQIAGQEIDAIRFKMGEAGRDIGVELATGLTLARDAIKSNSLEIAYDLASTNKIMADNMQTLSKDIQTSMATIGYSMRELVPTAAESFGNIGRALKLLKSENVGTGESFDFLTHSVADLGQGIGLLSEESAQFVGRVGDFARTIGAWFERVRTGGVNTDKSIRGIADQIETMGQQLKIQQGVLTRVFQENEANIKRQVATLAGWLDAMTKIRDEIGYVSREQEKSTMLSEEQRETLKALGIEGVAEYDKFKAKLMEVAQEHTRLKNIAESMGQAWRKHFATLGSLFARMETGAYHFGTTLESSGKISVDRIRDLQATMKNVNDTMQQMGKLGIQNFPALAGVMDRFKSNVDRVGRSVRELDAHERRLRESTGDLSSSFLQAEKSSGGFFSSLARLIPFVGKTKKNVDEMTVGVNQSVNRMGGGAERVVQNLGYTLGSVDPMFMEITQGARMMGYGVGAVMDDMDRTVAMKASGIVKSFGLIKLAAAGVIGVFAGLIISTGKLAADVTTLEMTMRTVGKNAGYSEKQIEGWRNAVKEMGITTRSATNAVTQFIRAKLPTEWYDPIQEATYSMEDLARAAQNLAVSVGEDSSETFNRFIYFIQSGNSQLLDTIGIAKNASVMLEEYAKAVGKTTKTLSQREYYEALISGLMREGAQIQGVYEEAMKTANKQLGSMVRYLEELRYEWGKYFEPILAVAIKRFNVFLQILTDIPERTKKTITTFITILTAISGLVLGIGVLLPKLKALVTFMRVGIGSLLSPVGLLITAVTFLGPKLLEMFSGFKLGEEGVEGMADKAGGLADQLLKIGERLKPLIDWVKNLADMISWHMDRISYKVGTIIKKLKERIDEFLVSHPEIAQFLERAKTVLGDLFSVIWRVIDKVLGAVEALLDQDFEGFMENLKEAATLIGTWVMEFFNEIVKSAFNWGKNVISAFVSGIVDKARSAIPHAMTTVGTMIANFLQGHSPAKLGPLSSIDQWGTGLMGSFERGLRRRRILFDEDMFLGMATLNAKAKVWGDNITTTFAQGIVGKAAGAIIPAMDYIGNMIALFLEGHSPPVTGKLIEIEDWGRNAFETFLSGFQMADFTILDRALDLVGQRISNLTASTKENAGQIAGAMMQIREAVAGAIFQARATGGPLDLSGINQIISGSIRVLAADIADVLEANFAALEAQAAFKRLQASIAAARAARQKAIQAAQDQLRNIQDAIKDKQKEVEALTKQMLEEFETRAKAAGIWVDPKLMEQLRREMERASVDVARAQRRLQRVRDASSRYGINLLTWEEINAQAQLDLAERRQQEIQEQIWTQEELQRQAEELRAQIEEEYKGQFEALQSQIEALQKRAEAAQENLEALQRADQAATAAENEQLAAAQAHAEELAAHAELMNKLLEERMKAEKDMAAMIAAQTEGTEEDTKEIEREYKKRKGWRPGARMREGAFETPEMSGLFATAKVKFEELLAGLGLSLEGGLGGLLNQIKEKIGTFIDSKIEEVTDWFFTQTKLGQLISDIREGRGVVGFWGTALQGFADNVKVFTDAIGDVWDMLKDFGQHILDEWWPEIQEILDHFSGFGQDIKEGWQPVIDWFKTTFGPVFDDLAEFLEPLVRVFFDFSELGNTALLDVLKKIIEKLLEFGEIGFDLIIEVLSELLQIFLDLIKLDFKSLQEDLGEIGEAFKEAGQRIADIFSGKALEDLGKWWRDLGRKIENGVQDMLRTIRRWMDKIPEAIRQPFIDVWNFLVGKSLIPDLMDSIVDFFASLPGRLLQVGKDLFNAAVDLGKQIVDGLVSKLSEIKLGEWLSEKASAIGNAAATFLNKALELGGNIVVGISTKVTELGQKIGGWLIEKASSITGAAQSFLQNALTLGQNILSGISQKITDLGTSIAGWLITAAQNITAAGYSFLTRAGEVGQKIIDGIYDAILGPYGLITKISSWLKSVAYWITSEDSGILGTFLSRAYSIGVNIMTGIKNGINDLIAWVGDTIKDIWNKPGGLRDAFQDIIYRITGAINGIIQVINDAAEALGLPWRLPLLIPPWLPKLEIGGIISQDTIAQLHAGEVVLPLDRLASVLRNANVQPVPAFAPVMNFYPGSNPQQVVPAIHQAYDWYIEELRRP